MLEGLAVEATSTESCCFSSKSATSVGEARWSGPLELPQCWTAPPHCPQCLPDSSSTLSAGASRQLRYTVSWSVMTLLLPILIASASFVGEWGGELRESRLEAWIRRPLEGGGGGSSTGARGEVWFHSHTADGKRLLLHSFLVGRCTNKSYSNL